MTKKPKRFDKRHKGKIQPPPQETGGVRVDAALTAAIANYDNSPKVSDFVHPTFHLNTQPQEPTTACINRILAEAGKQHPATLKEDWRFASADPVSDIRAFAEEYKKKAENNMLNQYGNLWEDHTVYSKQPQFPSNTGTQDEAEAETQPRPNRC